MIESSFLTFKQIRALLDIDWKVGLFGMRIWPWKIITEFINVGNVDGENKVTP